MNVTRTTDLFDARAGLRRIERRAANCLEFCRARLKLDSLPLPVPVDQWIEVPLGIQFGITDLSHFGPGILGAALLGEKREILIDPSVEAHEGRFRFTCAHELGHAQLHAKVVCQFLDNAFMQPSARRLEREADQFAAAFLMPLVSVQREIFSILVDARLDPSKQFIELIVPSEDSARLWKHVILPRFTRRFGVSLSAAVFRLRGIQLRQADRRPLLPDRHLPLLLTPTAAMTKAPSTPQPSLFGETAG
jgi:hypothetical protein